MLKVIMRNKKIILGVGIVILCFILFIQYMSGEQTRNLIDAIEENDVNTIERLLSDGVDPNKTDIPASPWWSVVETSARRPIAIACRVGNYDTVKMLIDYGATAEYIEYTGWSPLRQTLFYYHPNDLEMVKLLLQHGADAHMKEGVLPVFHAANMTPKVYDQTKANGTVFAGGYDEGTAKGITDIVMLLLGNDDVNITTDSGMSLLMYAVQQENIYLIEQLLLCGADTTLVNSQGKTASDYAVDTGNIQIVNMIYDTLG